MPTRMISCIKVDIKTMARVILRGLGLSHFPIVWNEHQVMLPDRIRSEELQPRR